MNERITSVPLSVSLSFERDGWWHGGRGGSSREGKRSLGLDQRAARIASDVDSRHVSVPSTTTGNGQPDAVDFGTSYNLLFVSRDS
jgi:hypothetical protein